MHGSSRRPFVSRDWRLYLSDIHESANRVIQYTRGMDKATFLGNHLTVDAVIRNLEIIGEASGRIPEEVAASYPNV